MAHDLDVNEDGSYSYAGAWPAWHREGKVLGHTFTAEEALEAAQINWLVEKVPLFTQDGQAVDRCVTVRMDKQVGDPDRILGVVGPAFEPVQNADAFVFFDSVCGPDKAIYDSVGALSHGQKVFVVAKLPKEFFVKEDRFEEYVTLLNGHTGLTAVSIFLTSVRVVCANTLAQALRGTETRVTLRHTRNVHQRMIDAPALLLGLVDHKFRETQELFNQLVARPISHPLFQQYVEEVFPTPAEKPGKRTRMHRESVTMLLDHETNTTPGIRHSWYSAFQSCVEYVDHLLPIREDKSRMDSVMFGSGANIKKRALELAWDYSRK